MHFCDLCTRLTKQSDDGIAMASKLGWTSVGVIAGEHWTGAKAIHVVEITPRKPSDVANTCRRLRRSHLVLAVSTRDLECARAALETPEADVLLYEGQINHVMAKLAKDNAVSIAFDFSRVLSISDRSRTMTLAEMIGNAKLVAKFNAPFILTSGAEDAWGLRSPRDLAAWGRTLGLGEKQCMHAVPDAIVKENKKRLGGKWLAPGVEFV